MRALWSLLFLLPITALAQEFTVVTYNVENLFDADGESVYDDYKLLDREGKPQYTPVHLGNKVRNIAAVMKKYKDGKGPDIIGFVEIEADQTPGVAVTAAAFLKRYKNTSLASMLAEPLKPEIATLPAELLLLKAFEEAGLTGYDVSSGEPELENGKPTSAVKAVIFSRYEVLHEKTKRHPMREARPVLETWIRHKNQELVLFVNHWKSGSGDPKQEAVRVDNGAALRARVEALAAERPDVDMILMGDFNSDYNQAVRYGFAETGINTKLRARGDEAAVGKDGAPALYNLWYELPPADRKSDAYRNDWGTLMHMIINGRLYDQKAVQYLDNSFQVGAFPGFNTLSWSGAPKRWNFGNGGSGYSDHFPLSARFVWTAGKDTAARMTLTNASVTDDALVKPNAVVWAVPSEGDALPVTVLSDPSARKQYQYQMFKIESAVSASFEVTVAGEAFTLFSQNFDFKAALADVAGSGKTVTMYGRLSQFRGKWQFLIDAPALVVR